MAINIDLETIAAPGATPISFNAASAISFANDFAKLVNPSGSSEQARKVISILGLIYELTAAGGANYKANHAGLMQDAQVYSGAIPRIDLATAMAALEWNAGKTADVTLSTSVPTLLEEGKDILTLPAERLDRILIFLRAQLRT